MTYSRGMKLAPVWITLAIALAIVLAVSVATPRPAGAAIHEIIAALCNGGDEVAPPGQTTPGKNSFLRALQATGFITSIVETDTQISIFFDPTVPNSKFLDSGGDFFLAGGAPDGSGRDIFLSPLPLPDPEFPAFANCFNFD